VNRQPQFETPLTIAPFDLDRVASGEALVLVELIDGRLVLAKLTDSERMYVPGDRVEIPATRNATRAKTAAKGHAMLLVGGMTGQGRSEDEIINALVRAGLLYDGGSREDQLRSLKRWRAAYRKWAGLPVGSYPRSLRLPPGTPFPIPIHFRVVSDGSKD
jgi:hypothetical protein